MNTTRRISPCMAANPVFSQPNNPEPISKSVARVCNPRARRRLKTDAAGVWEIGNSDQNRQTPSAPDAEPVACLNELAAMHASRHRRHQLTPAMNAKMILLLDAPATTRALEPNAIVRSGHRRWSRRRPGPTRRKGCQHLTRSPKPTFQARVALPEHVIEQRRYVAAD